MNLLIETDLGHDPDDFLAICWLVSRGVNIRAITITPGDLDQIATARLICRELGLNIPIGAAKVSTKMSSGSIHHEMLDAYGMAREAQADGPGYEIIKSIWTPDLHAFVIGPLSNVGEYLKRGGKPFASATMQGGFVPYSLYQPEVALDKFAGKDWVPTFNLNDDVEGAKAFLSADMPRQMVGKNVCHTVELTRETFSHFASPANRAGELYTEACSRYLNHHESKKLHDPTAAVCMLDPEVGLWIDGKTIRAKGGWTTVRGADQVLADIDRPRLWRHLTLLPL